MRRTLTIAATVFLVGCPPRPAYRVKSDAPDRVEIACAVTAVKSFAGVTGVVVNSPEPSRFQLDIQSAEGRVAVTVEHGDSKDTATIISGAGWRIKSEPASQLKERERFGQVVVAAIREQCSK